MGTYKGNFGILILTCQGTNASGKYATAGTIQGEFIDGKFNGTWKNKGLEGLVVFSIEGSKLKGSWKKGLDPGPMKGKWEGVEIDETSDVSSVSVGSYDSVVNLIDQYVKKVSDSNFDSSTLHHFKGEIEEYLQKFDFSDDANIKKVEAENSALMDLINTDLLRYLGLGLIYGEVLRNVSEGECSIYLGDDLLSEVSYSLDDLKDRGEGIAKAVFTDYGLKNFHPIFITKFISTLLIAFQETDDYPLLTELVLSCSTSEVDESLQSPWGDWISNLVVNIFEIHGYNPDDYASDETVSVWARYFMQAGVDSGYDYERLLENFRDSVI
jgi:hypothetical protein